MKQMGVSIILAAVVSLLACGNPSTTQQAQAPVSDSAVLETSTALPSDPPSPPQDSVVFLKEPPSAAPVQATSAQTAPGMNPPHGQPNHRCDIPVGAPLNSPPGKTAVQPVASSPNVPAQATVPQTAPGMNPPHGQPNHRCDIPVGAPLSLPPGRNPGAAAAPVLPVTEGP